MRSFKLAALVLASTVLFSAAMPASAAPVAVSSRAAPFHPNIAVTVIFASTASVILDAIYIAATQCREMTALEAGAALIPVVGPVYNSTLPSMNKCKK